MKPTVKERIKDWKKVSYITSSLGLIYMYLELPKERKEWKIKEIFEEIMASVLISLLKIIKPLI